MIKFQDLKQGDYVMADFDGKMEKLFSLTGMRKKYVLKMVFRNSGSRGMNCIHFPWMKSNY